MIESVMVQHMEEADRRMHREMEAEQISHPVSEYQPGSPRLERLLEQMQLAQKYQWPRFMEEI